MEVSPAARVGMITVGGLILLGMILTRLYAGNRAQGVPYYALFDRVEGLSVGAPVRLAGVEVGKVTDIAITEDKEKRVRVRFNVTYTQNDRPLEITQTSRYTITSDLLGNRWFEIVPRPGLLVPRDGTVTGVSPVTVDQLLTKGNDALSDLQTSVQEISKLVGDPDMKRNIRETVANFKELSMDFRGVVGNANSVITNLNRRISQISGHLDETVVGLHHHLSGIGGDFAALASTLRRIGERNEPDIRIIVKNLRDMAGSVRQTMAHVQRLVTRKEISEDLLAMTGALRRTAQELEGIAADIRGITSDPQLQKDIKQSIEDARETIASTKELVGNVQKVVGGFGGGSGKKGEKFRLYQFRTEMEYNSETTRLHPNAMLTLLPSLRYNLLVGLDSIGYDDLVNLQVGAWMGKNARTLRARAGVIRSKIGVGLDALLFNRVNFSADVYDPRRLKVDFLGRLDVAGNVYLMGGVRDVFRHTRSPVVGVGAKF